MTHPTDPERPDHQPTERIDTPTAEDPQAYAAEPQGAGPGGPPPPTGPAPSTGRSWFSGSRRTAIVAGVLGLVVGGVIGGSVGWAVTGNGDHDRRDAVYSRQSDRADGAREQGGQKQNGQGTKQRRTRSAVIGSITAINGSSWTIAARDGRTVTVAIGDTTAFGTEKKPQQRSDFVVGDRIAVVGQDKAGTIDAKRIAKRAAPAAGTPSSTAPGASTQPS